MSWSVPSPASWNWYGVPGRDTILRGFWFVRAASESAVQIITFSKGSIPTCNIRG